MQSKSQIFSQISPPDSFYSEPIKLDQVKLKILVKADLKLHLTNRRDELFS